MSEGLLVLGGALVGVLGTVLVDLIGGRRTRSENDRDALRRVGSDFAAQVVGYRIANWNLRRDPSDDELWARCVAAHENLTVQYERLRLLSKLYATQEAARQVVHQLYWAMQAIRHQPDVYEQWRDDAAGWLVKLMICLRSELDVARPETVYDDPPGGLPKPSWNPGLPTS